MAGGSARKALIVAAALVFVVFAVRLADRTRASAPDFAINWTAAQSIREGRPLYEADAQRELAARHDVRLDIPLYDDLYRSFIGLPTTAALHLPLTGLSLLTALRIHRFLELLAFGGAIGLLAWVVPRRSRWLAVGAGALTVVALDPFTDSLRLGQIDGWIVLALAFAVWCAARDRWWWCGIALGIPVLLKVSPALLVGYLLLRGRWQAVVAALGTVGAGLLLSVLIAPGALGDWWHHVRPGLADGTIHAQNMAAPAWLGRVFAPSDNLLDYSHSIPTMWRTATVLAGLVCISWLAFERRRARFDPLEIGVLIVGALLVGPVTWENYLTWLLVPIVLLADGDRWSNLSGPGVVARATGLGVAILILVRPVELYSSTVRVWSSGRPVALVLLLVVIVSTLRVDAPIREPASSAAGGARP